MEEEKSYKNEEEKSEKDEEEKSEEEESEEEEKEEEEKEEEKEEGNDCWGRISPKRPSRARETRYAPGSQLTTSTVGKLFTRCYLLGYSLSGSCATPRNTPRARKGNTSGFRYRTIARLGCYSSKHAQAEIGRLVDRPGPARKTLGCIECTPSRCLAFHSCPRQRLANFTKRSPKTISEESGDDNKESSRIWPNLEVFLKIERDIREISLLQRSSVADLKIRGNLSKILEEAVVRPI